MNSSTLLDSHGRVIRDLRVSVTDRCNFRCLYCLPETEEAANFYRTRFRGPTPSSVILRQWQPRSEILSFEELERVIRLCVGLGVEKIRLTGGEPLLRQNLEQLIGQVAAIGGVQDLALTTNGFLFPKKAAALKQAGLQRISFSLDSLDRDNFKKITGRDGLGSVLESINLARTLGFCPIKVNAVVIRGINDNEVETLAEFAKKEGISMRFIEFMPLDSGRTWLKELVVPGREILEKIKGCLELVPLTSTNKSETAKRWKIAGSDGEIGIIAPVSEPFCGHCNRLRLTADGKFRTCLFSLVEHDVKPLLRGSATDQEIQRFIQKVVWNKEDRHHIGEAGFEQPQRTMSCIGG